MRRFSYPKNEGVKGYFTNLRLADQVLGELREVLKEHHQLDDTTWVVTSDHGWRFVPEGGLTGKESRHYEVPFIVHLAGQSKAIEYHEPFNSVLIYDLILAIEKSKVVHARDLLPWIKSHRSLMAPQTNPPTVTPRFPIYLATGSVTRSNIVAYLESPYS